jgi:hypothetical protein
VDNGKEDVAHYSGGLNAGSKVPALIGGYKKSKTGAASSPWQGTIDLLVWNKELTAEQRDLLFRQGLDEALTDGLVYGMGD